MHRVKTRRKPLLIHIEAGKDKPYVFREHEVFVRKGDGDYHATRAQVDAFYPPKFH